MKLPLLSRISQILENKDYRRILDNILSLFSLQGLNYILPIITFPYLTRVLGPDKYGLVAFALAFIGYFQILTDYGFNMSATREISIHREDEEKVSRIYSSVMTTKALLMIISFLLMTIIVFSFDKFRSDWLLYYFTFGLVVGNLLMPTWFFQGMEKMRYISILNIGISLIYTAAIFIFIHSPSDYLYVPLISALGTIIMGLYALRFVHHEFNLKFILSTRADIKFQLEEGWHIFISTVASSLYTITNTFILGFFASPTIVGYYSVAERIVRIGIGLINPISQSIYPYISSLAVKSNREAIEFIKKVAIFMAIFTFIISLLLLLGAGPILIILTGNQYLNSIPLLQIMSFLPFIIGLSNVFGVLFLFAFGHSNLVSRVQITIGLCYPLMLIPMVYYMKDIGTALSFLIVEIVITLSFWKLYKNKVNEIKTC